MKKDINKKPSFSIKKIILLVVGVLFVGSAFVAALLGPKKTAVDLSIPARANSAGKSSGELSSLGELISPRSVAGNDKLKITKIKSHVNYPIFALDYFNRFVKTGETHALLNVGAGYALKIEDSAEDSILATLFVAEDDDAQKIFSGEKISAFKIYKDNADIEILEGTLGFNVAKDELLSFCQDKASALVNDSVSVIDVLDSNPSFVAKNDYDASGNTIALVTWNGKASGEKITFSCFASASSNEDIKIHSLRMNGDDLLGSLDFVSYNAKGEPRN